MKKQELLNNTLTIALGMIFSQLMSFLLLPIYTIFLSPSDYGLVDLIINYSALLFPIITIQLEMASFRFLVDARSNEYEKKKIISNVIQLLMVTLFICTTLYLIINRYIHVKYEYTTLLYVCASAIFYLFLQFARGIGKGRKFTIAYIVVGIVSLITTLVLVAYMRLGAQGMLTSLLIANLAGVIYLFFSLKLYNYISLGNRDNNLKKKLVKYSFPLIPDRVSWWVINLSDRTIVSIAISVAANGIYAVANKYAAIFTSIFNIFGLSWTESASIYIDDKNRDKFFSETINASLRLFSGLGLVLIAGIPIVFNVLIDSKYKDAYQYIPILISAALFSALGGLYGAIYIAKKKTKQIALTSIIAATINIVLNLVFIKSIGIYAAAMSTAAAYLTMAIYRHYDVKKYVRITYERWIFVKIAVLYLFTVALYHYNNAIGNIANLLIIIVVVIILNKSVIMVIKDKILDFSGRRRSKPTIEQ